MAFGGVSTVERLGDLSRQLHGVLDDLLGNIPVMGIRNKFDKNIRIAIVHKSVPYIIMVVAFRMENITSPSGITSRSCAPSGIFLRAYKSRIQLIAANIPGKFGWLLELPIPPSMTISVPVI